MLIPALLWHREYSHTVANVGQIDASTAQWLFKILFSSESYCLLVLFAFNFLNELLAFQAPDYCVWVTVYWTGLAKEIVSKETRCSLCVCVCASVRARVGIFPSCFRWRLRPVNSGPVRRTKPADEIKRITALGQQTVEWLTTWTPASDCPQVCFLIM